MANQSERKWWSGVKGIIPAYVGLGAVVAVVLLTGAASPASLVTSHGSSSAAVLLSSPSPTPTGATPTATPAPSPTTQPPPPPSTPSGNWYSNDHGCATEFLGVWYLCDMWYQSSSQTWLATNSGSATELISGPCSGNWCERKLTNGECMSYYLYGTLGTNVVSEHTCNMANYELWDLVQPKAGYYEWDNQYLVNDGCSDGDEQILTEHGNNSQIGMQCDDTYKTAGINQIWQLSQN